MTSRTTNNWRASHLLVLGGLNVDRFQGFEQSCSSVYGGVSIAIIKNTTRTVLSLCEKLDVMVSKEALMLMRQGRAGWNLATARSSREVFAQCQQGDIE